MSLAKAFVTGTVVKAPEKRFTQNDIAIVSFSINIDKNNETILRVISFGQSADNIANSITEGDNVAVEGKLQINAYKLPNGKEKRVYEIVAGAVEKISGNTATNPISASSADENIVQFDSVASEDLIDEDEIPF